MQYCILLKTSGQQHIVTDIIEYQPTCEASRHNVAHRAGSSSSSVVTQRLLPSHIEDKELKLATFVFKEEHRESINDAVQSVICSMCRKLLGIKKKHVQFEFDDNPGKKGYLCYSDLQDKLVALKLYGVSHDRVELYRKSLI